MVCIAAEVTGHSLQQHVSQRKEKLAPYGTDGRLLLTANF